MTAKEMDGLKFGRLTVVRRSGHLGKQMEPAWLCVCECGNYSTVRGSSLRKGATQSCGCLQRERSVQANRKHGHTSYRQARSKEYETWAAMINRCERPTHKDYHRYGGRGVRVCQRWRDNFANFLADVGEHPGQGLTLDRIDNNGNYEPGNVRWATLKQQRANQERSVSRR